jgi:hypothetical protein
MLEEHPSACDTMRLVFLYFSWIDWAGTKLKQQAEDSNGVISSTSDRVTPVAKTIYYSTLQQKYSYFPSKQISPSTLLLKHLGCGTTSDDYTIRIYTE